MLNQPQSHSRTHPLPRGGTDLIGTARCTKARAQPASLPACFSFALENCYALFQKSAGAFANVLSGEERAKKLPLERQAFFEIQLAAANNGFQTGSNCQRRELR